MPLTDIKIRSAKPRPKAYKLFDSGGLYLVVSPPAASIGVGNIALGEKRRACFWRIPGHWLSRREFKTARESAMLLVSSSRTASTLAKRAGRKIAQAGAESFEAIAREWHAEFSPGWVSSHGDRILRRLENDFFPWLGSGLSGKSRRPKCLAVLRRIESRGALETTHRRCRIAGKFFVMLSRRVEPSAIRPAIFAAPSPTERKASRFDHRTESHRRTAESHRLLSGLFRDQMRARLAPLVFVRPGELRQCTVAGNRS